MENDLHIYRKNVFEEEYLKKHISKKKFQKYKQMINNKKTFDYKIAQEVANVIKKWAIEKGATHYSLWFQPLSGTIAEKQNSFLSINKENKPIIDFSVSSLINGETDASSFPNGGLRSVFEARGLIKWDFSYPPFLKENLNSLVLYIPATLEAPDGTSLDKRRPLLNSCEALNQQILRLLRLFGDTESSEIFSTVGIEQEYFLIKKRYYKQRKDLMLTGRTLFGKKLLTPTKLHYMSSISEKSGKYMSKVEKELWKLGVPVQVKHNEVAPKQYEIVPHYEDLKLAANHDFLTMETLENVARNEDLICLLNEKPFKGISGSGKHNNWSIDTNTGKKLFSYGNTPKENAIFITIIVAFISAVDKYSDLIRATVASSNNDNRLSGFEAPSSIVSIYLGEELTNVFKEILNDKDNKIALGETLLPLYKTNITDRNRTAPLAFLGNRFEFRMPGSSSSIAVCTTILNTVMADFISEIANQLEGSKDFYGDLKKIVKKLYKEHSRIIYNGNSYSKEWEEEAKKRGLKNIKNAPEAFKAFIKEDSIKLFEKYNIYRRNELLSRYNIKLEKYIKNIKLEAEVMLEIAKQDILPQALKYTNFLEETTKKVEGLEYEKTYLSDIIKEINCLNANIYNLKLELDIVEKKNSIEDKAKYYSDKIKDKMEMLRDTVDTLEEMLPKEYWPTPTYFDILMN